MVHFISNALYEARYTQIAKKKEMTNLCGSCRWAGIRNNQRIVRVGNAIRPLQLNYAFHQRKLATATTTDSCFTISV